MRFSKLILLFILVPIGCNPHVLPGGKIIVAKYIVFDEVKSPENVDCSSEVRSFLEMEVNDCSFKLRNHKFDILAKYILDRSGNLSQYWKFKSEGPLTYTLEELQSDTLLYNSLNTGQLNIQLLKPGTHIVDSGDTLEIEKVFTKEHLVFVQRNQEMVTKNIRMIYEYN